MAADQPTAVQAKDDAAVAADKATVVKDEAKAKADTKKARDQNAPFVNESVNVLLDMVTLGSALPAPPALHAEAGMPGR
jgi:hypothetical protein